VAADLGVRSADHLIFIDESGAVGLAKAGVVATLLPIASFYLKLGRFAPARMLIAQGVAVALATDVNPGGGFSPSEPAIFRIPINSGAMSVVSVAGPAIGLSNTACSPVTEIFNPAAGGTDRIFGSVPNGSDAQPCSSGSCVNNLVISAWQPSTSYAVGQLVLDPANFWQVVAIAGTSKSGSAPSWFDTCGLETTDGTITWTNAGFLTPVTQTGWQANTFWSVGFRITDSNSNLECALETGIHSGITPPVWNTAIGGITTEVTGLQWRDGGPLPSHALPVAGGASGIIMDNIVGSGVLAGASEVYFSALSNGGCGAGNGCAVQASQSALN
jgi:hypothetical protein